MSPSAQGSLKRIGLLLDINQMKNVDEERRTTMDKIGVFVGEHGHWGFFKEIYADLSSQYTTQLFAEKTYTLPLLYGRLNRWAYNHQIRSLLQNNDACFFEWASELLVPASFLPKHCPIVTRLHSYEVTVWANQVNWANVDRIIFVSNYIRKKFLEAHSEQAAKTCIINNGVDLERFMPQAHKPFQFNIGIMGTILPVKRVYETIFTIAALRDSGYQPHLHIAGGKAPGGHYDGYYIAIVRAIEKLNLQEYVTLHGHVTDTERWLRTMDIYLSNSYWEGQSVALIEAMASGCYCMAHFWDGSEDVLPQSNLYASDQELARKLIAYSELAAAEKESWREQMRATACQRYDIRETSRQIRQVIDEVIHGSDFIPGRGTNSKVLTHPTPTERVLA
jgi:glycosyltransferase involved in cell wall biosynthesis